MQNIDLICVGKLNAPYFAAGVAEYQKLWTKRQSPFFPACAKGNISPHFAWKVNNFPVKSWQN